MCVCVCVCVVCVCQKNVWRKMKFRTSFFRLFSSILFKNMNPDG